MARERAEQSSLSLGTKSLGTRGSMEEYGGEQTDEALQLLVVRERERDREWESVGAESWCSEHGSQAPVAHCHRGPETRLDLVRLPRLPTG